MLEMVRIKIEDLPCLIELNPAEMTALSGGYGTGFSGSTVQVSNNNDTTATQTPTTGSTSENLTTGTSSAP